MNLGYYASAPTSQKWKWPSIAAQYYARVASRKKDTKLCIAKSSLNVDDTSGSSQDGLQDPLFCPLPFSK